MPSDLLYKRVRLRRRVATPNGNWSAGAEFIVGVEDGNRINLYRDGRLEIAELTPEDVEVCDE